MSTPVSCLQPCATPNRRTQSLQLASAIKARRILLNLSIEQAAEFSGLKPELWADLENGWLPPMDDPRFMWIWWSLASSLQVKADRLLGLAGEDLARQELQERLAKERSRIIEIPRVERGLAVVLPKTSVSQSLQLASAVRERRVHLLEATIKQAAEFSGLKMEQWTDLEAGWIPPLDNTLWMWWSLAGTLRVSVSRLFNLAGADLERREMLAKKKAAA